MKSRVYPHPLTELKSAALWNQNITQDGYTITTKYWKYQFISPSSLYLVQERVLLSPGPPVTTYN